VKHEAPDEQAGQPSALALTLIGLVTGLGGALLTWVVFTGWGDNSGRGSSTWWTVYVLTLLEVGAVAGACVHAMIRRRGWLAVLCGATLASWAVNFVNFTLFYFVVKVY